LDLDSTIFTGRWQFIGQFLLFHTKEEQVRSQSSTISNYFVFLAHHLYFLSWFGHG
jgi:hypothetical protein